MAEPGNATPAAAWLATLRWYLPLALVANLAWEMAQLPLYRLWREGTAGEIAAAVLHCSLGDGLIAAVALLLALVCSGRADWPQRGFARTAVAATIMGIAYTIWSEWLNINVRGAWAYTAAMPTVSPLGIGLAPLAQWLVLPGLCLTLARRRALGSSRQAPALQPGSAAGPLPARKGFHHVL